MNGNRTSTALLAASAALSALLLAGCGMGGSQHLASASTKAVAPDKLGKGVVKAEAAVAASPRDAALRAELAGAYLGAGRFVSAAQSYDDALRLGDESAGSALGYALAQTAIGNTPAALEVLQDYKDVIPASDLGLAFALAGDPVRGVNVLEAALRGGDNSAKVRQNLAFAYAAGGRWNEARVMAAQDVPADQVNQRMLAWAMMGKPGDSQTRVASLVGVTPVEDAGQPQALALANTPDVQQLAAEAQAQVPAPAAETPAAAPVQQAALELPAVAPAAAGPAPQPIVLAAAERPASAAIASDAPAFVALPASLGRSAVKPRVVARFVPEGRNEVRPGRAKGLAAIAALAKYSVGGSHWVQLGSYTNPAVAAEGWGKFTRRNPALKGYKQVTTTAVVNGTNVWRVAATGFASYADAAKMCAGVKAKGGACLVKRAEATGGR